MYSTTVRPTAHGAANALRCCNLLRLSRMRHAVRKLLKGEQPVKVGVVGGSVTFLEDDVKAIGWWAKLARYITLAFPKTKVGQGGDLHVGWREPRQHHCFTGWCCLVLPGAAWCCLGLPCTSPLCPP
jgi:hypothetical protein